MKSSSLKHKIDIAELNYKHEIDLITLKHEQEVKELKTQCTHEYDDGSSTYVFKGTQWDPYSVCEICGKSKNG